MTRTVLESKTKTVVIGFDEPFCVIGERINPTGRKKLAAELEAGNYETVIKDALEQVACGATVLDVNSGAVFTNKMAEDPRYADNNFVEPPLMKALIGEIEFPIWQGGAGMLAFQQAEVAREFDRFMTPKLPV